MTPDVTIVGGGLAGSECAYQLARFGFTVRLIEQKPIARSEAHRSDMLAELVCSNSFRGSALTNAVGLLKEEMRRCGCLFMRAGALAQVPAGGAMAVDREDFSREISREIREHPKIELVSEKVNRIPDSRPLVLATGPLTSDELSQELAHAIGVEHLSYYDAISPVISADSIAWDSVFKASRYGKGEDNAYVNCPMDEVLYSDFVRAISEADRVEAHDFEDHTYFEGCLPIEVLVERGFKTLCFGPMKPVGLIDPRTGRQPFAVVQLRQENREATAWNMVGFQTRMNRRAQKRIFSMIPGLEAAQFERFGSIHRNTFVNAPQVLDEMLAVKNLEEVYLAGQITGVEGYVESAASGLCLALMLAQSLSGSKPEPPPKTTALGALLAYLQREQRDFQPSNITWNMFPSLSVEVRQKHQRREAMVERALKDLDRWISRRVKVPLSRTSS